MGPERLIIAGSRVGPRFEHVDLAMRFLGWRPSVVLSGTAVGGDAAGEAWAAWYGVPVERYPPNWREHGRSAGMRRNSQMRRNADGLLALWDGFSPGARHMIDEAQRHGLLVHVVRV